MKAIANGALYNTTPLADDEFLSRFVARGDLAAFLLGQLKATGPIDPAEHHLIVGMRGMGKTSLLRRVAIGVIRDEDLTQRFAPLTFREEQYNILSLDGLWRNCGEALAEWCERAGLTAYAERLDKSVESASWRDPETAQREFLSSCRSLGRRPVLLIDNIDLILEALSQQENWALRRVLQAKDGPILFGAATQFLAQSGDRKAPFYEFFRPHHLEPLSSAEVMACLRALADSRGAAGDQVRATLAKEPERLEALHTLTGGNPRILVILYSLLEAAGDRTAFQDLEALLDQVTPLYKARVEEYQTKLQRAVIDAIALNWNPITAHDLSGATGIQVTTISSQLVRLERDGLIESVQTSGARAGFQMVERFFNIWYLMRHGSRRTRNRVRWLTEFLLGLYTPDELKNMSVMTVEGEIGFQRHKFYHEALLVAVEESSNMFFSSSGKSTLRKSNAGEDPPEAERGSFEFGMNIRSYIQGGDFAGALNAAEDEIRRLSSAPESALRERMFDAIFEKGFALGKLGRGEDAFVVYDDLIRRFSDASEPALREPVARAMFNKGIMLAALGRPEDEIVVYDDLIRRFGDASEPALREPVAKAMVAKGFALGKVGRGEDEIVVYDDLFLRFGDASEPALREQVARAMVNKGFRLGALGRGEDAVVVYDDLIRRFGDASEPALREPVARAMFNKGFRLDALGRAEDAVVVYDDLIWRFGDASEAALRERVAMAMVNKGNILIDQVSMPGAAEEAYRRAIAVEGKAVSQFPEANLAWLLIGINRLHEALEIIASLNDFPAVGTSLLNSAIEFASSNFGNGCRHFQDALNGDQRELASTFFDDQLRLLRIARSRGYGEQLIGWFEESGQADRQAPLFAAFVAFVRGEEKLLDFNPEVRGAADRIYAWLTNRRSSHSEVGDPDIKKRTRRRRK